MSWRHNCCLNWWRKEYWVVIVCLQCIMNQWCHNQGENVRFDPVSNKDMSWTLCIHDVLVIVLWRSQSEVSVKVSTMVAGMVWYLPPQEEDLVSEVPSLRSQYETYGGKRLPGVLLTQKIYVFDPHALCGQRPKKYLPGARGSLPTTQVAMPRDEVDEGTEWWAQFIIILSWARARAVLVQHQQAWCWPSSSSGETRSVQFLEMVRLLASPGR